MRIIQVINPHNISETEASTFEKQEAVRAIVFDKERDKIATQYSTNHHYHKLPGGGLEGQEDLLTALKRECREELGYDIEIENELGDIIEYRKDAEQKLLRVSHCYVAHITGEQHQLNLDAGELRAGFVVEWLTLDEAITTQEKEIAEASKHRNNQYILPRDLAIVQYFKSL